MAIQIVNIGQAANDGTGDTARTAFSKINNNFTDQGNAAGRLIGNAQDGAWTVPIIDPNWGLSISGGITNGKANFSAKPHGGANGQKSGYSFFGTFGGTVNDTNPRRCADIYAGYEGGTWGNEHLSFGVAGATDANNITVERVRITGSTTIIKNRLNLENGIKVGVNAPAIQMVKFEGTIASLSSVTTVNHGLDYAKIISCSVAILPTGWGWIYQSIPTDIGPGMQYAFNINAGNVDIITNGNSSNLTGKPFKIFITYEV